MQPWRLLPRVVRLVLHCLEVRLLKGLSSETWGTTEVPVYAQRCEEPRQRVTLRRHATVRVNGQAPLDAVTRYRVGKQLCCQMLALLRRDHPANDMTAEEVEDDVRMQEGAFQRRGQLCDVSRPNLVRGCRAERWLCVGVRQTLISPLFRFPKLGKHAVDGANRCQVDALTEQLPEYLHRRLIDEFRPVHHVDDGLPFVVRIRSALAHRRGGVGAGASIRRGPDSTPERRIPHGRTRLARPSHPPGPPRLAVALVQRCAQQLVSFLSEPDGHVGDVQLLLRLRVALDEFHDAPLSFSELRLAPHLLRRQPRHAVVAELRPPRRHERPVEAFLAQHPAESAALAADQTAAGFLHDAQLVGCAEYSAPPLADSLKRRFAPTGGWLLILRWAASSRITEWFGHDPLPILRPLVLMFPGGAVSNDVGTLGPPEVGRKCSQTRADGDRPYAAKSASVGCVAAYARHGS
jgi:hypothetical protein